MSISWERKLFCWTCWTKVFLKDMKRQEEKTTKEWNCDHSNCLFSSRNMYHLSSHHYTHMTQIICCYGLFSRKEKQICWLLHAVAGIAAVVLSDCIVVEGTVLSPVLSWTLTEPCQMIPNKGTSGEFGESLFYCCGIRGSLRISLRMWVEMYWPTLFGQYL